MYSINLGLVAFEKSPHGCPSPAAKTRGTLHFSSVDGSGSCSPCCNFARGCKECADENNDHGERRGVDPLAADVALWDISK